MKKTCRPVEIACGSRPRRVRRTRYTRTAHPCEDGARSGFEGAPHNGSLHGRGSRRSIRNRGPTSTHSRTTSFGSHSRPSTWGSSPRFVRATCSSSTDRIDASRIPTSPWHFSRSCRGLLAASAFRFTTSAFPTTTRRRTAIATIRSSTSWPPTCSRAGNGVRVLLPNAFVSQDRELGSILDPIWGRPEFGDVERHGSSFWLEIGGTGTTP